MSVSKKDIKDISELIRKKLELYMNVERRETRFDPRGRYTTTPKMSPDRSKSAKRVTDRPKSSLVRSSHSPRRERRQNRRVISPGNEKRRKLEESRSKSGSRKKDVPADRAGKSYPRPDTTMDESSVVSESVQTNASSSVHSRVSSNGIKPRLDDSPSRVVLHREKDRLSTYATKIFSEVPVDEIQLIHRYRPYYEDNGEPKYQGYSRHVGSILKSKNFVQFYNNEALQHSLEKENTDSREKLPPTKRSSKPVPRAIKGRQGTRGHDDVIRTAKSSRHTVFSSLIDTAGTGTRLVKTTSKEFATSSIESLTPTFTSSFHNIDTSTFPPSHDPYRPSEQDRPPSPGERFRYGRSVSIASIKSTVTVNFNENKLEEKDRSVSFPIIKHSQENQVTDERASKKERKSKQAKDYTEYYEDPNTKVKVDREKSNVEITKHETIEKDKQLYNIKQIVVVSVDDKKEQDEKSSVLEKQESIEHIENDYSESSVETESVNQHEVSDRTLSPISDNELSETAEVNEKRETVLITEEMQTQTDEKAKEEKSVTIGDVQIMNAKRHGCLKPLRHSPSPDLTKERRRKKKNVKDMKDTSKDREQKDSTGNNETIMYVAVEENKVEKDVKETLSAVKQNKDHKTIGDDQKFDSEDVRTEQQEDVKDEYEDDFEDETASPRDITPRPDSTVIEDKDISNQEPISVPSTNESLTQEKDTASQITPISKNMVQELDTQENGDHIRELHSTEVNVEIKPSIDRTDDQSINCVTENIGSAPIPTPDDKTAQKMEYNIPKTEFKVDSDQEVQQKEINESINEAKSETEQADNKFTKRCTTDIPVVEHVEETKVNQLDNKETSEIVSKTNEDNGKQILGTENEVSVKENVEEFKRRDLSGKGLYISNSSINTLIISGAEYDPNDKKSAKAFTQNDISVDPTGDKEALLLTGDIQNNDVICDSNTKEKESYSLQTQTISSQTTQTLNSVQIQTISDMQTQTINSTSTQTVTTTESQTDKQRKMSVSSVDSFLVVEYAQQNACEIEMVDIATSPIPETLFIVAPKETSSVVISDSALMPVEDSMQIESDIKKESEDIAPSKPIVESAALDAIETLNNETSSGKDEEVIQSFQTKMKDKMTDDISSKMDVDTKEERPSTDVNLEDQIPIPGKEEELTENDKTLIQNESIECKIETYESNIAGDNVDEKRDKEVIHGDIKHIDQEEDKDLISHENEEKTLVGRETDKSVEPDNKMIEKVVKVLQPVDKENVTEEMVSVEERFTKEDQRKEIQDSEIKEETICKKDTDAGLEDKVTHSVLETDHVTICKDELVVLSSAYENDKASLKDLEEAKTNEIKQEPKTVEMINISEPGPTENIDETEESSQAKFGTVYTEEKSLVESERKEDEGKMNEKSDTVNMTAVFDSNLNDIPFNNLSNVSVEMEIDNQETKVDVNKVCKMNDEKEDTSSIGVQGKLMDNNDGAVNKIGHDIAGSENIKVTLDTDIAEQTLEQTINEHEIQKKADTIESVAITSIDSEHVSLKSDENLQIKKEDVSQETQIAIDEKSKLSGEDSLKEETPLGVKADISQTNSSKDFHVDGRPSGAKTQNEIGLVEYGSGEKREMTVKNDETFTESDNNQKDTIAQEICGDGNDVKDVFLTEEPLVENKTDYSDEKLKPSVETTCEPDGKSEGNEKRSIYKEEEKETALDIISDEKSLSNEDDTKHEEKNFIQENEKMIVIENSENNIPTEKPPNERNEVNPTHESNSVHFLIITNYKVYNNNEKDNGENNVAQDVGINDDEGYKISEEQLETSKVHEAEISKNNDCNKEVDMNDVKSDLDLDKEEKSKSFQLENEIKFAAKGESIPDEKSDNDKDQSIDIQAIDHNQGISPDIVTTHMDLKREDEEVGKVSQLKDEGTVTQQSNDAKDANFEDDITYKREIEIDEKGVIQGQGNNQNLSSEHDVANKLTKEGNKTEITDTISKPIESDQDLKPSDDINITDLETDKESQKIGIMVEQRDEKTSQKPDDAIPVDKEISTLLKKDKESKENDITVRQSDEEKVPQQTDDAKDIRVDNVNSTKSEFDIEVKESKIINSQNDDKEEMRDPGQSIQTEHEILTTTPEQKKEIGEEIAINQYQDTCLKNTYEYNNTTQRGLETEVENTDTTDIPTDEKSTLLQSNETKDVDLDDKGLTTTGESVIENKDGDSIQKLDDNEVIQESDNDQEHEILTTIEEQENEIIETGPVTDFQGTSPNTTNEAFSKTQTVSETESENADKMGISSSNKIVIQQVDDHNDQRLRDKILKTDGSDIETDESKILHESNDVTGNNQDLSTDDEILSSTTDKENEKKKIEIVTIDQDTSAVTMTDKTSIIQDQFDTKEENVEVSHISADEKKIKQQQDETNISSLEENIVTDGPSNTENEVIHKQTDGERVGQGSDHNKDFGAESETDRAKKTEEKEIEKAMNVTHEQENVLDIKDNGDNVTSHIDIKEENKEADIVNVSCNKKDVISKPDEIKDLNSENGNIETKGEMQIDNKESEDNYRPIDDKEVIEGPKRNLDQCIEKVLDDKSDDTPLVTQVSIQVIQKEVEMNQDVLFEKEVEATYMNISNLASKVDNATLEVIVQTNDAVDTETDLVSHTNENEAIGKNEQKEYISNDNEAGAIEKEIIDKYVSVSENKDEKEKQISHEEENAKSKVDELDKISATNNETDNKEIVANKDTDNANNGHLKMDVKTGNDEEEVNEKIIGNVDKAPMQSDIGQDKSLEEINVGENLSSKSETDSEKKESGEICGDKDAKSPRQENTTGKDKDTCLLEENTSRTLGENGEQIATEDSREDEIVSQNISRTEDKKLNHEEEINVQQESVSILPNNADQFDDKVSAKEEVMHDTESTGKSDTNETTKEKSHDRLHLQEGHDSDRVSTTTESVLVQEVPTTENYPSSMTDVKKNLVENNNEETHYHNLEPSSVNKHEDVKPNDDFIPTEQLVRGSKEVDTYEKATVSSDKENKTEVIDASNNDIDDSLKKESASKLVSDTKFLTTGDETKVVKEGEDEEKVVTLPVNSKENETGEKTVKNIGTDLVEVDHSIVKGDLLQENKDIVKNHVTSSRTILENMQTEKDMELESNDIFDELKENITEMKEADDNISEKTYVQSPDVKGYIQAVVEKSVEEVHLQSRDTGVSVKNDNDNQVLTLKEPTGTDNKNLQKEKHDQADFRDLSKAPETEDNDKDETKTYYSPASEPIESLPAIVPSYLEDEALETKRSDGLNRPDTEEIDNFKVKDLNENTQPDADSSLISTVLQPECNDTEEYQGKGTQNQYQSEFNKELSGEVKILENRHNLESDNVKHAKVIEEHSIIGTANTANLKAIDSEAATAIAEKVDSISEEEKDKWFEDKHAVVISNDINREKEFEVKDFIETITHVQQDEDRDISQNASSQKECDCKSSLKIQEIDSIGNVNVVKEHFEIQKEGLDTQKSEESPQDAVSQGSGLEDVTNKQELEINELLCQAIHSKQDDYETSVIQRNGDHETNISKDEIQISIPKQNDDNEWQELVVTKSLDEDRSDSVEDCSKEKCVFNDRIDAVPQTSENYLPKTTSVTEESQTSKETNSDDSNTESYSSSSGNSSQSKSETSSEGLTATTTDIITENTLISTVCEENSTDSVTQISDERFSQNITDRLVTAGEDGSSEKIKKTCGLSDIQNEIEGEMSCEGTLTAEDETLTNVSQITSSNQLSQSLIIKESDKSMDSETEKIEKSGNESNVSKSDVPICDNEIIGEQINTGGVENQGNLQHKDDKSLTPETNEPQHSIESPSDNINISSKNENQSDGDSDNQDTSQGISEISFSSEIQKNAEGTMQHGQMTFDTETATKLAIQDNKGTQTISKSKDLVPTKDLELSAINESEENESKPSSDTLPMSETPVKSSEESPDNSKSDIENFQSKPVIENLVENLEGSLKHVDESEKPHIPQGTVSPNDTSVKSERFADDENLKYNEKTVDNILQTNITMINDPGLSDLKTDKEKKIENNLSEKCPSTADQYKINAEIGEEGQQTGEIATSQKTEWDLNNAKSNIDSLNQSEDTTAMEEHSFEAKAEKDYIDSLESKRSSTERPESVVKEYDATADEDKKNYNNFDNIQTEPLLPKTETGMQNEMTQIKVIEKEICPSGDDASEPKETYLKDDVFVAPIPKPIDTISKINKDMYEENKHKNDNQRETRSETQIELKENNNNGEIECSLVDIQGTKIQNEFKEAKISQSESDKCPSQEIVLETKDTNVALNSKMSNTPIVTENPMNAENEEDSVTLSEKKSETQSDLKDSIDTDENVSSPEIDGGDKVVSDIGTDVSETSTTKQLKNLTENIEEHGKHKGEAEGADIRLQTDGMEENKYTATESVSETKETCVDDKLAFDLKGREILTYSKNINEITDENSDNLIEKRTETQTELKDNDDTNESICLQESDGDDKGVNPNADVLVTSKTHENLSEKTEDNDIRESEKESVGLEEMNDKNIEEQIILKVTETIGIEENKYSVLGVTTETKECDVPAEETSDCKTLPEKVETQVVFENKSEDKNKEHFKEKINEERADDSKVHLTDSKITDSYTTTEIEKEMPIVDDNTINSHTVETDTSSIDDHKDPLLLDKLSPDQPVSVQKPIIGQSTVLGDKEEVTEENLLHVSKSNLITSDNMKGDIITNTEEDERQDSDALVLETNEEASNGEDVKEKSVSEDENNIRIETSNVQNYDGIYTLSKETEMRISNETLAKNDENELEAEPTDQTKEIISKDNKDSECKMVETEDSSGDKVNSSTTTMKEANLENKILQITQKDYNTPCTSEQTAGIGDIKMSKGGELTERQLNFETGNEANDIICAFSTQSKEEKTHEDLDSECKSVEEGDIVADKVKANIERTDENLEQVTKIKENNTTSKIELTIDHRDVNIGEPKETKINPETENESGDRTGTTDITYIEEETQDDPHSECKIVEESDSSTEKVRSDILSKEKNQENETQHVTEMSNIITTPEGDQTADKEDLTMSIGKSKETQLSPETENEASVKICRFNTDSVEDKTNADPESESKMVEESDSSADKVNAEIRVKRENLDNEREEVAEMKDDNITSTIELSIESDSLNVKIREQKETKINSETENESNDETYTTDIKNKEEETHADPSSDYKTIEEDDSSAIKIESDIPFKEENQEYDTQQVTEMKLNNETSTSELTISSGDLNEVIMESNEAMLKFETDNEEKDKSCTDTESNDYKSNDSPAGHHSEETPTYQTKEDINHDDKDSEYALLAEGDSSEDKENTAISIKDNRENDTQQVTEMKTDSTTSTSEPTVDADDLNVIIGEPKETHFIPETENKARNEICSTDTQSLEEKTHEGHNLESKMEEENDSSIYKVNTGIAFKEEIIDNETQQVKDIKDDNTTSTNEQTINSGDLNLNIEEPKETKLNSETENESNDKTCTTDIKNKEEQTHEDPNSDYKIVEEADSSAIKVENDIPFKEKNDTQQVTEIKLNYETSTSELTIGSGDLNEITMESNEAQAKDKSCTTDSESNDGPIGHHSEETPTYQTKEDINHDDKDSEYALLAEGDSSEDKENTAISIKDNRENDAQQVTEMKTDSTTSTSEPTVDADDLNVNIIEPKEMQLIPETENKARNEICSTNTQSLEEKIHEGHNLESKVEEENDSSTYNINTGIAFKEEDIDNQTQQVKDIKDGNTTSTSEETIKSGDLNENIGEPKETKLNSETENESNDRTSTTDFKSIETEINNDPNSECKIVREGDSSEDKVNPDTVVKHKNLEPEALQITEKKGNSATSTTESAADSTDLYVNTGKSAETQLYPEKDNEAKDKTCTEDSESNEPKPNKDPAVNSSEETSRDQAIENINHGNKDSEHMVVDEDNSSGVKNNISLKDENLENESKHVTNNNTTSTSEQSAYSGDLIVDGGEPKDAQFNAETKIEADDKTCTSTITFNAVKPQEDSNSECKVEEDGDSSVDKVKRGIVIEERSSENETNQVLEIKDNNSPSTSELTADSEETKTTDETKSNSLSVVDPTLTQVSSESDSTPRSTSEDTSYTDTFETLSDGQTTAESRNITSQTSGKVGSQHVKEMNTAEPRRSSLSDLEELPLE